MRLRKLSQTCEFNKPDDEIKCQITSGCLSWSLRRSALKAEKLTLEDLLLKARSRSKQNTSGADGNSTPFIHRTSKLEISEAKTVQKFRNNKNQVRKYGNNSTQAATKKSTCYNCGFDFPHTTGPCPACGKTCSSCKSKNHFTRCCKSKNATKTHKNPQCGKSRLINTPPHRQYPVTMTMYLTWMDATKKTKAGSFCEDKSGGYQISS